MMNTRGDDEQVQQSSDAAPEWTSEPSAFYERGFIGTLEKD